MLGHGGPRIRLRGRDGHDHVLVQCVQVRLQGDRLPGSNVGTVLLIELITPLPDPSAGHKGLVEQIQLLQAHAAPGVRDGPRPSHRHRGARPLLLEHRAEGREVDGLPLIHPVLNVVHARKQTEGVERKLQLVLIQVIRVIRVAALEDHPGVGQVAADRAARLHVLRGLHPPQVHSRGHDASRLHERRRLPEVVVDELEELCTSGLGTLLTAEVDEEVAP
mmetsp:Transcript_43967/g.125887  ORF Transcript_43967/g.125887 Transcript_43967/m.125887 type:complete len:220 (-) Transcript_43967:98-757(-)